MSQHITGSVGQSVTHEDGPFILIHDFRVRKSLIQAYCIANHNPGEGLPLQDGIMITFSNGRYFVKIDNQEAAQKEIERLDWIFKKDYQD